MSDPGRSSRKRILIIDDQEPTRYVFRHSLSRAGFEIDEAVNGSDGLAKALTEPDLIICDVNLPDMLGYDVCRRLKSNPVTLSIPVLQISASFVSDESKVQALEGGADSYLTQPVEPMVLIAQVNSLLRLRRAESVANLSARQWQTTFDSLSDGVVLLNSEHVIVRTNRTLRDLLGLVPSDTDGKALAGIFYEKFGISFDEFLQQHGEGIPVELPCANRWFRLRQNVIESDPQAEDGSVLLITDITAHRKLQETLKFNERLAATGRLAHVIAHEINNPLEAMSNLLFLAERSSEDSSETRVYVEQASKELLRISQITKQVLAYHRESREPIPTRADEILENVLTMYRSHIMGSKVTLETRVRCSGEILVRPGELRQVFGNVIANALDAIGSNGGVLRIRCFNTTDQRTQQEGVRFIFSDSGSGVPEEMIPNIFDAFFTTKGAEGSGVGLWLSMDLIKKHGGYIRVRSRLKGPYRGTLFAVFLPLHSQ
ncbi:ATP-binding protein [Granulicella cerasi]|uniref:histidine kinase n=1 Tax=Granulicella cerasi TaxID=741063 RepID=A0ABW1Z9N3_9BACT|nr:ATP-binding protein [Granulicella cerasi]